MFETNFSGHNTISGDTSAPPPCYGSGLLRLKIFELNRLLACV